MAKRKKVSKVTERLTMDQAKDLTNEVNNTSKKSSSNNQEPNSKQRVKLTTMINPQLRDQLKILAIQKGVKFSDLLEEVIKEYLDKK
jgi:hypothetical protein